METNGNIEKRSTSQKGKGRSKSAFMTFFSSKSRKSPKVESDVKAADDNPTASVALPTQEVKRKKKVGSNRGSRGNAHGLSLPNDRQGLVSSKSPSDPAAFDEPSTGGVQQDGQKECVSNGRPESETGGGNSGLDTDGIIPEVQQHTELVTEFVVPRKTDVFQLYDGNDNNISATPSEINDNDVVEASITLSSSDRLSEPESPKKTVSFTDDGPYRNEHTKTTEVIDAYRRDSLYVDASFDDEDDDSDDDDEEECYEEDDIDSNGGLLRHNGVIRQKSVREAHPTEDKKPIPKSQRVALEIYTTEESYLRRLTIIETFRKRLEEENSKQRVVSDENMLQLFSNFQSLFDFHKENLLPLLQERIKKWETLPLIGDIMKKFAPFLKMYTPYIKNIDSARSLLLSLKQKSTKLSAIVSDIEQMPQCSRLPLPDFFAEPMSRLLRYKLLLSEYLRRLPEGAVDRPETEDALELISVTATQVNEAIRAEDNVAKIVKIQENLRDPCNLVIPGRRFIKEGRLAMIDPRKGTQHLERHIYLFNDLLLVCQPPTMGLRYRLQKQVSLRGVKLEDEVGHNTFTVISRRAVVELYGSTQQEAADWVSTLKGVLDEYAEKDPDAFLQSSVNLTIEDELGYHAPRLVRSNTARSCNQCGLGFVSLRRRKVYCMACGQAFCQRCSTRSVQLAYDGWKPGRVCDRCYSALKDDALCHSIEDLENEQWIMNNQRL